MTRPLIAGLVKLRNEVVREGNVYRCLANMKKLCDVIVACDDASTDGTDLVLKEFWAENNYDPKHLLFVDPIEQMFERELAVKQRMLDVIHELEPRWIWWQDGDEILDDENIARLRPWLVNSEAADPQMLADGYRFPYVQLWRSGSWSRLDDGFGDSSFIKLWLWRADLKFKIVQKTHHAQFPVNLGNRIAIAPFGMEVVHVGNYGANLKWKCIQYANGLGGVDRHLEFDGASYLKLARDYSTYPSTPAVEEPKPEPFRLVDKELIRRMGNLRGLEGWFSVIVPTHNRAAFLPETIDSLKKQTYPFWVAFVLDDGSTDDTMDVMRKLVASDVRVFYVQHKKRGAVAMNEIGAAMAIEATQWWTRLGSDDYFTPDKLMLDAVTLRSAEWCYGPFRVLRLEDNGWKETELCGLPEEPSATKAALLRGEFRCSWANVAMRTSLLYKIRKRYGNVCDPSLQNMEDFLVNARAAREAMPAWRGRVHALNQPEVVEVRDGANKYAYKFALGLANEGKLLHDAVWRVNPIGASANTGLTGSEDEATRKIILRENAGE